MCQNKYLLYTCQTFVLTSIFVGLFALRANDLPTYFTLLSSLILLKLFAFFVGSFFGFLFGFPNHNNKKFKDKYQRNSSLKEITSWLTKIIVGVTLVEFKSIIGSIYGMVKASSVYISNDLSLVPIIGAILGIYFLMGFIVFFILSVTTIFEELVTNDKNIEKLLSSSTMAPEPLGINNVLNIDFSEIKNEDREEILKYVASHGVKELDAFLTKRLAKFLLAMMEYSSAAEAYEVAYDKNPSDKYSFLNACYIRSRYLKQFDGSNNKLKAFIEKYPSFAPAYYNLACNYCREFNEFDTNTSGNEYVTKLKTKAEINLQKAFEYDKGLYSEALKDDQLTGLDIPAIFAKSKKQL